MDDQMYMTAHATLSQAPFQYYTAYPPALPVQAFPRQCTPYAGGCKQGHVTTDTIDDFNALYISKATRIPNPRPSTNTQLFGTAPYKARGDGILKATDTHSAMISSGFNPHCAKNLSERDYDRFECMTAPLMVEDERITGPRGGMQTRVGPGMYMC